MHNNPQFSIFREKLVKFENNQVSINENSS